MYKVPTIINQSEASTSCLFKGIVTDEDGKAVENASVIAFLDSHEPINVVSDKNGCFLLGGIKEGNYFIRASAAGFMVCTHDVHVSKEDSEGIVLKLKRGEINLGGRIYNDDGAPLKAEVTLLKSGIVIQKTWSEVKSGRYSFQDLITGRYEIQATAACYSARAWSGEATGSLTQIDLTLSFLDGCTMLGKCDVCEVAKEVRYCKFCHAYICNDCRHNYPERVKAMFRRRFSELRKSPNESELEAEYEKELKDAPTATTRNCCSG